MPKSKSSSSSSSKSKAKPVVQSEKKLTMNDFVRQEIAKIGDETLSKAIHDFIFDPSDRQSPFLSPYENGNLKGQALKDLQQLGQAFNTVGDTFGTMEKKDDIRLKAKTILVYAKENLYAYRANTLLSMASPKERKFQVRLEKLAEGFETSFAKRANLAELGANDPNANSSAEPIQEKEEVEIPVPVDKAAFKQKFEAIFNNTQKPDTTELDKATKNLSELILAGNMDSKEFKLLSDQVFKLASKAKLQKKLNELTELVTLEKAVLSYLTFPGSIQSPEFKTIQNDLITLISREKNRDNPILITLEETQNQKGEIKELQVNILEWLQIKLSEAKTLISKTRLIRSKDENGQEHLIFQVQEGTRPKVMYHEDRLLGAYHNKVDALHKSLYDPIAKMNSKNIQATGVADDNSLNVEEAETKPSTISFSESATVVEFNRGDTLADLAKKPRETVFTFAEDNISPSEEDSSENEHVVETNIALETVQSAEIVDTNNITSSIAQANLAEQVKEENVTTISVKHADHPDHNAHSTKDIEKVLRSEHQHEEDVKQQAGNNTTYPYELTYMSAWVGFMSQDIHKIFDKVKDNKNTGIVDALKNPAMTFEDLYRSKPDIIKKLPSKTIAKYRALFDLKNHLNRMLVQIDQFKKAVPAPSVGELNKKLDEFKHQTNHHLEEVMDKSSANLSLIKRAFGFKGEVGKEAKKLSEKPYVFPGKH